ncbi:MAG: hypothetical protein J0M24_05820 [Verrucomicrobia bacterium]|nr:hypothetical protein [Verrucomicrobiota bacterium]
MKNETYAMIENLTKASQTAGLLIGDLRAAGRFKGALVGMLVLDLIDEAAMLEKSIARLLSAVEKDAGETAPPR